MPTFAKVIVLASVFALPVACKKPDEGRGAKRTVKASIADFDPNEEVVLDLEKYGTARADDFMVSQSFERTFDGLDACVAKTKKKHKIDPDTALEGDVEFTVKLNPSSERPSAVHAVISSKKWDQNEDLKDCLRDAVAKGGYPPYDGPPQVAVFNTQLDPGTKVEDDNDW